MTDITNTIFSLLILENEDDWNMGYMGYGILYLYKYKDKGVGITISLYIIIYEE